MLAITHYYEISEEVFVIHHRPSSFIFASAIPSARLPIEMIIYRRHATLLFSPFPLIFSIFRRVLISILMMHTPPHSWTPISLGGELRRYCTFLRHELLAQHITY